MLSDRKHSALLWVTEEEEKDEEEEKIRELELCLGLDLFILMLNRFFLCNLTHDY